MLTAAKLNIKIIFHLMGLLLVVNGGFMLLASICSFAYADGIGVDMVLAGLSTLLIGGGLMYGTKNHKKELGKRDGYIIVTFGWIFMSLAGTLPYIFTGTIPSFANAFFELFR